MRDLLSTYKVSLNIYYFSQFFEILFSNFYSFFFKNDCATKYNGILNGCKHQFEI